MRDRLSRSGRAANCGIEVETGLPVLIVKRVVNGEGVGSR
jgi:hypothetical protein